MQKGGSVRQGCAEILMGHFHRASSILEISSKIHQFNTLPFRHLRLDSYAFQVGKMVRKLKHHEQKLLKKTDFITYKQDNGHRDHNVIRRTLRH